MRRDIQRNADLWDDIADKIENVSMAAADAAEKLLARGLQLGFLLLEFAERPEIQAEIKRANERGKGKKPGPKSTPHGYVARKLSRQYKDRLPSLRWMRDCARAALEAKKRELPTGNVEKLIGWRKGISAGTSTIVIEPPDPARLLGLKADEAKKDSPPRSYKENLLALLNGLVRDAEKVVECCAREPNWSYTTSAELLQAPMAQLDSQLQRIGYGIRHKIRR